MFAHRLGRHLSKRSVHSCGTASFASNVPREDRDFAVALIGGGTLVGVVDGHCGSRVAEIVSRDLPKLIQAKLAASGPADQEELLKQSYLELDAEILNYATTVQHSLVQQGACVLSAVVGETQITVANAGDSGALLVRKDETWSWLNKFHNAGNPEEQARLKSAHPNEPDVVECVKLSRPMNSPMGDSITSVCYTKGMLQPTRAIGDWYLKESRFKPKNARNFHPPYLSAEPEIVQVQRDPDMAYLVLATDGLWEVLGASDVARLLVENAAEDQDTLARLLLDECLSRAGEAVGISGEMLKMKPPRVSSRNIVDDLTISVVDLKK